MSKNEGFRRFGNVLVGEVPWGTHLCQFYENKEDLIDILVPYFAEGLRNNEFCMWVTSPPLEVEEAKAALSKVLPNLDEYFRKGQIEIISYDNWYLSGGKFDSNKVLQGWVQKEKDAIQRGFDGLRLTGNTFWIERDLWSKFVDYEETVNAVIGEHKIIALCTYCLKNCSGTDVVDVVRNHSGTLIKQGQKWSLVEDIIERKKAEDELKKSEAELSSLFANMTDGFAYYKMIFDEKGKPTDFVYLKINDAFEKITGLKRDLIVGKKVTEAIPGIKEADPEIFEIYGRVALTGQKERFEVFFKPSNSWLLVSAYCPREGYFAAVFEDITERKKSETEREIMVEFLRIANVTTGTRDLINGALDFFQKQSGCEAVGVRLKEGDDYPYYETKGFPPEHVQLENKLCASDEAGCIIRDSKGKPALECMCGNVICGRFDPSKKFFTENGSFWTNSTTQLLATTTMQTAKGTRATVATVKGMSQWR